MLDERDGNANLRELLRIGLFKVDNDRFPKLDRTVFSVVSLQEQDDEVEYWKTKTPQERWEALELMRQMIYGYDPIATRLQRVFEFAERPAS